MTYTQLVIQEFPTSPALSESSNGVEERSGEVTILPPVDVFETLSSFSDVGAVILDPWYNRGVGGVRDDYHDWLAEVIHASCQISDHIFVWGFPEILAYQIPRIPEGCHLLAWLTWFYKNCPSVIRGWRSAQNTCLHIARQGARVYPQHFLNAEQKIRFANRKMRFVPGPPSVLESPLNIGFVRRNEQTEHPAQKPLAVIEPLVLMATEEGDTVLDPMCGSGTTGEACLRVNRNAILCDLSPEYTEIAQSRIDRYMAGNGR